MCDAQRFILLNCPLYHHSLRLANGEAVAWALSMSMLRLSTWVFRIFSLVLRSLVHLLIRTVRNGVQRNEILVIIFLGIKLIISYFERQRFETTRIIFNLLKLIDQDIHGRDNLFACFVGPSLCPKSGESTVILFVNGI